MDGPGLKIWVGRESREGQQPTLELSVDKLEELGDRVGLSSTEAPVGLGSLVVRAGEKESAAQITEKIGLPAAFQRGGDQAPVNDLPRSRLQALHSFCLVLLNLNEFVYID